MWVGTGWKMNHTLAMAREYVNKLKEGLGENEHNVFVIPPYTALPLVCEMTIGTPILVGAQNMHWEDHGSVTGEISPLMLKELGVDIIEIGHSERRESFGETDVTVNKKTLASLKHGFKPLICFGDPIDVKEAGGSAEYVSLQVRKALIGVTPDQADSIILAYEPIWAIGEGGKPASGEFAGGVIAAVKHLVKELLGEAGTGIPILYGGSVNLDNAGEYMVQDSIDGVFVGRSAWKAEGLLSLVDLADLKSNK